jgi:hypothetical protein
LKILQVFPIGGFSFTLQQILPMTRIGFVFFCLFVVACGNNKKNEKEASGFSYEVFSEGFKTALLPYQLTDTGLLRNSDTTSVKSPQFVQFISDSIRTKIFGKGTKVKYVPLVKISAGEDVTYYIIKASGGGRKAALMLVFNKDQFGNLFPFLIPDGSALTTQLSLIDKTASISRMITQRRPNNIATEGKEVFVYDAASKQFSLILVNPLNNDNAAIINPIDTLPRKHKFSGDYLKNAKNFVSIRDGRYPNQLLVFIHMEKQEPECSGELKGELLLTSPTAAIYRQAGDPCIMSFRFGSNAITVREDEGCGSHRSLECTFDGTYTRKKEAKPKTKKKGK